MVSIAEPRTPHPGHVSDSDVLRSLLVQSSEFVIKAQIIFATGMIIGNPTAIQKVGFGEPGAGGLAVHHWLSCVHVPIRAE